MLGIPHTGRRPSNLRASWSGSSPGVKPHGLWVLCPDAAVDPGKIAGLLWASIEDSLGTPVCSVNSLWVEVPRRNSNLVPLLAGACLDWARTHGAKRLDCSTHVSNARMRQILEKHGFTQGMVQYSLPLSP